MNERYMGRLTCAKKEQGTEFIPNVFANLLYSVFLVVTAMNTEYISRTLLRCVDDRLL